jgi:hypothetical protein
MNLVEMIGHYVPAEALAKMGSAAGLGSDETKTVASGAVPLVAAGLARMGSTEQGAGNLLELARRTGAEGMVDRIGDMIGSEQSRRTVMESGGGILSSLFGSKGSGILDAFTAQTGASSTGTRSFLAMLAPLALGALGRHTRSQGLGVGGLASMLSGQSGALANMIPGGLGKLLGGGVPSMDARARMEEAAREVPTQARIPEPMRARGQVQPRRFGGPAVVAMLIALGFLAWAFSRQRRPEVERQARTAPTSAVPAPGMQRQPPGQGIDALASYPGANLEGQRFSLTEITLESGTGQLTQESARQVDRLAGAMKEREGMKVRLEGARAGSVRDALAARGIAAERVSTAAERSGTPGGAGGEAPGLVDVVVIQP